MNVVKKVNEILSWLYKMEDMHKKSSGLNDFTQDQIYWDINQAISNHRIIQDFAKLWLNNVAKTLVLSKDLVNAFKNTDVPMDISFKDINYPFDCFMIESSDPLFYTTSKDSNILDIPVFNICFYSSKINGFPLLGNGHSCLVGYSYIKDFMGINTFSDYAGPSIKDTFKIHKQNEKAIKDMINIFFNTVLYINDPSRKVSETESHGTRNQSDGLGKRYTQDFIRLNVHKNYKSIQHDSSGRTLDVRLIVMGHWKRQVHGENRSLRKWIWVCPYYKGPEFGQQVNKPYLVK
jgi:hypothetical protein